MKNFYQKSSLLILLLMLAAFATKAQTNQYLHFDGVNDYVALPNASQYIADAPGITMAGWFYDDKLAYGQGMMGFRGSQGFYMIQLADGKIECRFQNSNNTLFEYVAPANTTIPQVWQHFAWVYNGSEVILYVNGVQKGKASANGTFSAANITFGIGKSILGDFNFLYNGRIDEVSVWSKALTKEEVQFVMGNELKGNESGLQLYYNFNQGVPGGDNSAITKLVSKVGSPARDADLLNFAMTGETSNFNGTLDTRYQAIAFSSIPNKFTTDPAFTVDATSTAGLDVTVKVISGPATISGKTVTLTGDAGLVVLEATQPGTADFDPAEPVQQRFNVINTALHVPDIDVRNPLAGDVFISSLSQIQLAAISTIKFPELFSVAGMQFKVNGEVIPAQNFFNGHFTAWWTPPAYGTYDIEMLSTSNFGAVGKKVISITIKQPANDVSVNAFKDIWISPTNTSQIADGELPSYLGAFDKISATLKVHCPTGGCGAWDRVASVEARDKEGKWIEIIRYITPYGTACSHTVDLTDYRSILQGKVSFRVSCGTLDNGYLYDLDFDYRKGEPAHMYSRVTEVWHEIFPFGNYDNAQPVDTFNYKFPDNAVASTLKLVSTGHGWGDLNTNNAAEFYEATHNLWVNGVKTFTQHNWTVCNPNPDGCQPQSGTWYYDRAGWCPGSIAKWFDYDMSTYVAKKDLTLNYLFYDQYFDKCNSSNPNCTTGVTCDDCADGFNPTLDVACYLVSFADSPMVIVSNKEYAPVSSLLTISPNPAPGKFEVSMLPTAVATNAMLIVYDNMGRPLKVMPWNGQKMNVDMSSSPKGLYTIKLVNGNKSEVRKLILK